MEKSFDFTHHYRDEYVWVADVPNANSDRIIILCYEGMLKWFDVPKTCKNIRITLSDKKLKHGYRSRFTRNWPEATLGENEIYDELNKRWVQETLTCGADALVMNVFKPGKALRFEYWVAVSTIDGT
jgi:hypothetical protein